MKTITFFSEKGGVGKTSFTMLYASWLKYKYGIKTAVADFNLRIDSYRNREIRTREKFIRKNPDCGLEPFNLDEAWPNVSITAREIDNMRKYSEFPHAYWLKNEMLEGRLRENDVIICDFPGSLSGREFLDVRINNLIGLIIIPLERETQTLLSTHKLLNYLNDDNRCVFLNRTELNLPNVKLKYIKFARELVKSGWPMLPDLVSYSKRMSDMDRIDDIRSTMYYPDFSQPQYGNAHDLGFENLFIDITRELVKTEDIPGTMTANLSFIKKLQKIDDGRQYTGSAFPEYENR